MADRIFSGEIPAGHGPIDDCDVGGIRVVVVLSECTSADEGNRKGLEVATVAIAVGGVSGEVG